MSFGRKWKPSRSAARAFYDKMDAVQVFCDEYGISHSATMDSYYFTVNGQRYRVSNHTVAASNRGAFQTDIRTGELVQMRDKYHQGGDDLICITASKTRLPEIYAALVAGKRLDGRGYEKQSPAEP